MGHRPHFRPIKRCIFCQQKAKSSEHGWSEWAIRDLAFQGGIIGAVDDIPYHDSAQKHLKVRCVCVPCNTIWMKRLEDAIRPTIGRMMFDAVMELDIHQQWAITQWAIKTSMVFEHINRQTDIFYTDEERSLLRTTGDIPPHTAAWIARADGDISFFTRGSYGFAGDDIVRVDSHVTTIAYRRFVVQVITARVDQNIDGSILVRLDGDHEMWKDTMTKVWPTQNVAVWPQAMSIAHGALDSFHERFNHATVEDTSTVKG